MGTYPKAPCSVCGYLFRLLKNGTIGYHAGNERGRAGFRTKCAGVGQPPQQPEEGDVLVP